MRMTRVILLLPAVLILGMQTNLSADWVAPGTPLTDEYVLGPTSPGKWGSPVFGTGATVTWSLMPSGVATDSGLSTALSVFMPAGYLTQIQAAFAAWSSVANITFTQVADSGLPFNDPAATAGDIRIGGHAFDGAGGTLAHGFFPPVNGSTAAGDIHFDTAETWKIGFGGGGFDIFQVAAHEIGHAIGLAHTGVAASLMNPFYTEAFSGPQADDIAGAQFIYGAPVTATPEPASMALLALTGLGGLGLRWRQRRKTTAQTAA